MPKFRATTLFQQGKAGWSESFYTESSTPLAALNYVKAASHLRRRLLADNASIIGYRAQQVDAVGNAQIEDVNEPAIGGTTADIAPMSLIIQMGTTDGLKRQFLLRGIPDTRVSGGVFIGGGAYNGHLTSWEAAIAGGNFLVRRINRANVPLAVASVAANGLLTTFVAHGLEAGDEVQFLRTRDTAGHLVFDRFRVLDAPTATTAVLSPWTAGRLVSQGQIRLLTYIYPAINTAVHTNKVTTRKVGRPFGGPRGRRSTRR